MEGFEPDTHAAEQWSDPFKGGWIAHKQGSCIKFNVSGSIIMLQYRKTINKPAPVAYAVIDGEQAKQSFFLTQTLTRIGETFAVLRRYTAEQRENTLLR